MSRYCAEPSQGHDQQDETRVQSVHDFPVKAGFTGESDKFRSPSALARANAGFEAMAPCYGWRSPHTRGARGQALRRLGPRRIIPAYAGSTTERKENPDAYRDHPRIRGEHSSWSLTPFTISGSSPHKRGAPIFCAAMSVARWIIPAYAGSTPSPAQRLRAETNHPRIRGEHGVAGRLGTRGGGSSPHTRGAPPGRPDIRPGLVDHPRIRGEHSALSQSRPGGTDHPRIRGEHLPRYLGNPRYDGSSPHTRGAPRRPRAGGR